MINDEISISYQELDFAASTLAMKKFPD